MPRRERRKCSVCQKTGHNTRTCTIFAAQEKQRNNTSATTQEVINNIIDETTVVDDVIDGPLHISELSIPSPVKKVQQEVFVRQSFAEMQSPHVINLAPQCNDEEVRSIDVFRASYERLHTSEAIDFASLIRHEKKRAVHRRIKAPAFQVNSHVNLSPAVRPLAISDPLLNNREVLTRTVRQTKKAFVAPSFFRMQIPKIRIPNITVPKFSFSVGNIRPMAIGISLLACLIAIPYPALGYISTVKRDSATIMAVSTEGFLALQASTMAAFTADIDGAASSLHTALDAFSTATHLLHTEHTWLQSIASFLPVVGSQVTGGQHLLTAGHHMALGNTYLLQGIHTARGEQHTTLTSRLEVIRSHMRSAVVQYDAALTSIASIPESAIPKEYRKKANEFQLLFGIFVHDMYAVIDLIDVLLLVLGHTEVKQYLVMFQNNHELRPTGGFMGSYAILTVDRGTVHWEIPPGGTYDVQGQLTLNYVPPLPLQVVNNKWELQDANWWSHVPASAALIEELYENSRPNDSLDGVFFVNATVLTDVLAAIGTIIDPITGEELSSEYIIDFINERKRIDEAEDNQPKKVLSELVPTILASLEAGGQDVVLKLLLTLSSSLHDKSIQLSVHDEDIQQTLRAYGWTGETREIEPTQDYLQVVRTNLQGQKSDVNIKESITLDTELRDTGSIINTLTITRTHTGLVQGDLYDATNLIYLRAYVPKGSTLISADGFTFPPESAFKVPSRFSLTHPLEARLATKAIIDRASGTYMYDEFNKTVFANWVMVPPGESRTIKISYTLPFTIEDLNASVSGAYLPYTMIHQKQSGLLSDIVHTVRFPDSWNVHWKSYAGIHSGGNFALYKSKYERDMYYGLILEKK
jgi:hypothetical protein